jgi:APA family basic amino acid/polyamine antiporter
MIAGSGAIAAIAIIFGNYFAEFVTLPRLSPNLEQMPLHIPLLGDIFPLEKIGVKCVASLIVALLTYINIRGIKVGAMLQTISTSAKVIAIIAVIAVAFLLGSHVGSIANWSGITQNGTALSGWTLIGGIATAVTGAFWAYDGWGNVAYIGDEVKDPTKTLPRAIILATFVFISLYLLMNLAYYYILPIGEVATVADDRVASAMVTRAIGGAGGAFVAALIMLSTFDTTNSTILTNARVYYAMAKNRVFSQKAAGVHPKYQTPHGALLLQGAWSIFLIFSGSFGLLLDMYIFVNWLLYVFMALGVFVLRKRKPDAERPFLVPGYPYVPLTFVIFAATYVIVTLVTDYAAFNAGERPIMQSAMGLVLVFSGLPFYYFWKYKDRAAN